MPSRPLALKETAERVQRVDDPSAVVRRPALHVDGDRLLQRVLVGSPRVVQFLEVLVIFRALRDTDDQWARSRIGVGLLSKAVEQVAHVVDEIFARLAGKRGRFIGPTQLADERSGRGERAFECIRRSLAAHKRVDGDGRDRQENGRRCARSSADANLLDALLLPSKERHVFGGDAADRRDELKQLV